MSEVIKNWRKKVIMRDITDYATMVHSDWVYNYIDNPEIQDGQSVKKMSEDYNCKYEYLLEVIKLGAKIVSDNYKPTNKDYL